MTATGVSSFRPAFLRISAITLFLSLAGPLSHAAELEVSETEPAASSDRFLSRYDFTDRFQAYCSELIFRFANWTDLWLDNGINGESDAPPTLDRQALERYAREDVRRSSVRVSPSVRLRESGQVDFDFDFSARLRLPRTSHRTRLVLDRGDWLPDLGRDFEGRGGVEVFDRDSGRGTAGIDLRLYERTRFGVSLRTGLNFAPEPEPRLQVAIFARYPLGNDWVLRPRQAVFWDAGDGFGEKTKLEVERLFADRLLLRFGNELIWSESTRGAELSQNANLFYYLSNRRMIGAKLGVFEYTHPNLVVDEYRIRFPYRQRVGKAWLYVQLEPGARFSRDNDYGFSPEFTITVDLLAGHVPE